MSSRRFGIEIECGMDHKRGDQSFPPPPATPREDTYAKRMAEFNRVRSTLIDQRNDLGVDRYWGEHMGWDGTMIEVRSPILEGKNGFKQIHDVMNLLTRLGGYVTESDGMHVHIDAPEYVNDVKAVIRLVKTWHQNQHLIHSFVAPRRRSSSACGPWQATVIKELDEFGEKGYRDEQIPTFSGYRTSRRLNDFKDGHWSRRDLNLSALREHGSIEIRLHEGCLDPDKAEAWIKLGQSLLDSCVSRAKPVAPLNTREDLLRRLNVPKAAAERLLAVPVTA